MIRIGRLLFLAVVVVGFFVAARRLGEQNVPLADVAATGLTFAAALVAFFVVLLGLGKILGKLLGGSDSRE